MEIHSDLPGPSYGVSIPLRHGDTYPAPDVPGRQWMWLEYSDVAPDDATMPKELQRRDSFSGWTLIADPSDPPSKYHHWDDTTGDWALGDAVTLLPAILNPGGGPLPAGPPSSPTGDGDGLVAGGNEPVLGGDGYRYDPDPVADIPAYNPKPGDEMRSDIPGKKYVYVVNDDIDPTNMGHTSGTGWALIDDPDNPPSKYHVWDPDTFSWTLPVKPPPPEPGTVASDRYQPPSPEPVPPPDPVPGGPRWLLLLFGLVAVAAIAAIVAFLVLRDDEPDSTNPQTIESVRVSPPTSAAEVPDPTEAPTTAAATTTPITDPVETAAPTEPTVTIPAVTLPPDLAELLEWLALSPEFADAKTDVTDLGEPLLDSGDPAPDYPGSMTIDGASFAKLATGPAGIPPENPGMFVLGGFPVGPVDVLAISLTEPFDLGVPGQAQFGLSSVEPDRPTAPENADPNAGTNKAVIADLASAELIAIGYDGAWAQQPVDGLFAAFGRAAVFVVPASDHPYRLWSFWRFPADDPAAGASQRVPASGFITMPPAAD